MAPRLTRLKVLRGRALLTLFRFVFSITDWHVLVLLVQTSANDECVNSQVSVSGL